MDITRDTLETQISPPPQVARLMDVDTMSYIRKAIERHPDKTPDEITATLNAEGMPVSGIWVARVAQIMQDEKAKGIGK